MEEKLKEIFFWVMINFKECPCKKCGIYEECRNKYDGWTAMQKCSETLMQECIKDIGLEVGD